LPPPVARTLDAAAAERGTGPLLPTRTGARMDRHANYIVAAFIAGAA
jgi:hypothetical protein